MTIKNKQTGLIYHDSTKAFQGYTLFAPGSVGSLGQAYLIDMDGRVVHMWDLGGWIRYHVELLENGNIFGGRFDKEKELPKMIFLGGELCEWDWDGNVVWGYDDPEMDLHDRAPLKNGNVMIMRHVKIPEEIRGKVKGGVPGSETDYGFDDMHGFVFQEIDRDGEIVNEFNVWEKLDYDIDEIQAYGSRGVWPGQNSIEELVNGDLVTSSYNTNTIYIWDRQSGEVKWRWGKGTISFPHDSTELPNGNILVHDNQRYPSLWMPPDGTRVLEVNRETGEVEWQFRTDNPTDFHNTYVGGQQRLPNGNTLICSGARGHFFEVTSQGEVVWEFVSPFHFNYSTPAIQLGQSNAVFRCYRYAPDHPGLQGRDLDPGRYANLNNLYGLGSGSGGTVSGSAGQAVLSGFSQDVSSLAGQSSEDKVAARAELLGY